MNVQTILKTKGTRVVTVKPETTVTDALRVLKQERIGAVVISPDGKAVAGILSERDVVRTLADRGADTLARPVSEVMTKAVVTCDAKDTIVELMDRMTQGHFRHMPVVEGDELSGMISIGDVVKARLSQVESEAEALRTYITQ